MLRQQADKGDIALYFQDESGFSLVPSVPYAWQPRGKSIALPCARSQRLHVIGALKTNCDWKSVMMQGRMNANRFIQAIEQLFPVCKQETWLVLDNSPIHVNQTVQAKIPQWQTRNLHLFFLPTYSPQLNLAETVWRFIKYYWLPFSAYLSFSQFRKILENILENIGTKYLINFV
jgi:transposase